MDLPNQNSLALVLFMAMAAGISWYSKHVMTPKRTCPACDATVDDSHGGECHVCGAELGSHRSGQSAR